MKNFSCFRCIIAYLTTPYMLATFSSAQSGEWTWMKGSYVPFGSAGTWGTQGIPDEANEPPSVYEACEWKDQNDNLWIFGGVNNSAIIYYSTLWKYETDSNRWVWMKGPSTAGAPGVYGVKGVPNAANYPGARGWGADSWTDTSGNFWLFGGYGYDANGALGCLGDLWKYDVSANVWTWMKGSNLANYAGSYGVKGVPDTTNHPPSRQENSCTWVDQNNNLWMFGGWGPSGNLNDLWKYDIPSNTWTWMKGTIAVNQYGTYGTQGIPAPANNPGSRAAYSRWLDPDGNLWLYGGNGYSAAGNGYLSDLWKYDVSTGDWTWMHGSKVPFQKGIYGARCEYAPDHYPGDKMEGRSCWTDDCGYFYIYGGTGYFGHQGDLWAFNYSTNEWAWIFGDTTTNTGPVPGTQGVSSPANKPGLRTGANSWTDQAGSLWMFGGYVCSSDMWRFVPDYGCIGAGLCSLVPEAQFTVSDTALCEKFCADFFDLSANDPVSWSWTFQGADPASASDQNPVNICYDNPGQFDVTLVCTDASGNADTLFLDDYITVYQNPFAPVISQNGNVLSSSPAATYQWQLNGTDIAGATGQEYEITGSGLYTVIITDANGCVSQANIKAVFVGVPEVSVAASIRIHPNPSDGNFLIEFPKGISGEVRITIRNVTGEKMYDEWVSLSGIAAKKAVSFRSQPGSYVVAVTASTFTAHCIMEVSY